MSGALTFFLSFVTEPFWAKRSMVSNLQFSETFPQRGMDFRRVPMKFLFHKKRCEAGWAMSLLEGFILIPRPVDEYFGPHGMVYMGLSVAVPGKGP